MQQSKIIQQVYLDKNLYTQLDVAAALTGCRKSGFISLIIAWYWENQDKIQDGKFFSYLRSFNRRQPGVKAVSFYITEQDKGVLRKCVNKATDYAEFDVSERQLLLTSLVEYLKAFSFKINL